MLTAKIVVKNKFWIVEKDGQQVATIQTSPEGVSYVYNEKREKFVSFKLLKDKYNIIFNNDKKKKPAITFDVGGFPCDHRPYNPLFDVTKKLPVFTKTSKSKSFFCAGYYLIKFNLDYVQSYCPKLITLNRYEFIGPFHSVNEVKETTKHLKEKK